MKSFKQFITRHPYQIFDMIDLDIQDKVFFSTWNKVSSQVNQITNAALVIEELQDFEIIIVGLRN